MSMTYHPVGPPALAHLPRQGNNAVKEDGFSIRPQRMRSTYRPEDGLEIRPTRGDGLEIRPATW